MSNHSKYQFNTLSGIISILITELIFWLIALLCFRYISLNVEEFRFEHPNLLWLFLFIPFYIIIWIYNRKWKNNALLKYSSLKLLPNLFNGISNTRSIIKFILFKIGLSFIIIAMANPQYGENEREVQSKGIDIMIALDVSKSMLADDLIKGHSRLSIAKKGISKLIKNLHGDQIGIVVFAGDAYKQLPITPDYQVANMFLKNIETQMISSQGTDIGNAIEKCVSSFNYERETNKSIIVISDGEDHEGNGAIAAREANENGIIINTIGMGTSKGVPIPVIRNGKAIGIKKDKDNQTVLTKLNEKMLIDIANEGDGIYSRAKGMNIGIESIIKRIDTIEKSTLNVDRYTSYDDQYQLFLTIGIILLLIDFLINEKRGEIDNKLTLFKT